MWLTIRTVIFTGMTITLLGCASTNFTRPDFESLHNGQTTYVQVAEIMGKPRKEGVFITNEKTLKTASYAYTSNFKQPLHSNVMAARTIMFYFYNDILVGHAFVSSCAEDHTDFDEGKRININKGKTTRAEVLKLLGRPSGYFIYPMINSSTGEAAVYGFSEISYAISGYNHFHKKLVVMFDAAEIVTDITFVSSGSQ